MGSFLENKNGHDPLGIAARLETLSALLGYCIPAFAASSRQPARSFMSVKERPVKANWKAKAMVRSRQVAPER